MLSALKKQALAAILGELLFAIIVFLVFFFKWIRA